MPASKRKTVPHRRSPVHPIPNRPADGSANLSESERAVLLTVLYADLFDYALTRQEVFHRLVGTPRDGASVAGAILSLEGRYLDSIGDFIVWKGRDQLAPLRRRRSRTTEALWPTVNRYARWLARVPFVRMVAVSGSLAVQNAEHNSDVDLFCITEPNRLWLARAFIVPMSKMTRKMPRRFPMALCPNYILTTGSLAVLDQNLFTAHEVAQALPVVGAQVYEQFIEANAWVSGFLPHVKSGDRSLDIAEPVAPFPKRIAERVLGGSVGDLFDRMLHRLFVAFYRKRAEGNGWSWARLESAYRRDRYTVPEGGYARAVYRFFGERVHQRLNGHIPQETIDHLFALDQHDVNEGVYDWEGLLKKDYDLRDNRPSI